MNTPRKLLALGTSAILVLSMAATTTAADPERGEKAPEGTGTSDYIPSTLSKTQVSLRNEALNLVLSGQATPTGDNKVVRVPGGQFVELAFEGSDQILTLLGEFGAGVATHNHGDPAAGGFGVIDHGGVAGPLHNEIPEPDRTVDNTTIWEPDFNQSYYDNLLYNPNLVPSMANWYLAQSAGRYTVDGFVSDWVQVPNNAAAYGSDYCGSNVCTRDVGRFIEDQADAWWNVLVAQQGSVAAANAWLATFDIWDRYDFDGDGNFDEPDGYIDHFQSVHAGEGQETGGGAQGTDAIWSHRSFVNSIPFGAGGPPAGPAFGGAQIGGSDYWIGDYTVEPENGGVGVFAHEFGHDLDLPDEYDTSGNVGGAENGTAWWTTWSQGSYGTIGDDLGTYPVSMTSYEKLFLGWLDFDLAFPGQHSVHKLTPIESQTKRTQSVVVLLPDKETSVDVGDPLEGSWFYHSGSGNNLDNNMTRPITLPAGTNTLTFDAKYHIEACWDYAYVEVSTDGGTTFASIPNSAESPENTNGQNFGHGITGTSGTALVCDQFGTPVWVNITADLTPYAGQTIQLRFRYWTDGAAVGDGISVDNILITGQEADGGETEPGWTYDGFVRTTGVITKSFLNLYLAEYRTYTGYDKALEVGPYNFTDPDGNFVEHFSYQDGLLIWYYDESQSDNNVGDHPGEGLILPIDAHPEIGHWSDGTVARPRLQSYDATFGVDRTEALSIPSTVSGTYAVPSKPAVRVFDDTLSYYVASDPADGASHYQAGWNSVNHPHTGTTIKVVNVSGNGGFMQVELN